MGFTKELKLFIWDDVLADYTSGIAFALAENVNEAKKMISDKFIKENGYLSDILKADLFKEPKVIDSKYSFFMWGGG